jgi:uncharacterized protein (TIGR00730 family)
MKRICVYCGSSPGFGPVYIEAAKNLGAEIARSCFELVFGGAEVGLMGVVADAVIGAGGKAIGIIPKSFASKVSHRGLADLRIVPSMHDRKQLMFDLSDAFVALPGGFGTIEELTEILTWAQLGIHQKPCGFINIAGYFDSFLSFLDHAVAEGFLRQEHRNMLLVSDDPRSLFRLFSSCATPIVGKWAGVQTRK